MAFVRHYMLPVSVESAPDWTDTANAYDGNIATYALSAPNNNWITFIAPPDRGYANYAKFYCALIQGEYEVDADVTVEIYANGVWKQAYNGITTKNTWIECYFTGNKAIIEKIRIRCNNTLGFSSLRLKEIVVEVQWVDPIDYWDPNEYWSNENNAKDGNFNTYASSNTGSAGTDKALVLNSVLSGFGDVGAIRIKADAGSSVAANIGICDDVEGDSLWTGDIDGVLEIQNTQLSTPISFPYAGYYPNNSSQSIRLFEVQYCGEYTTPAQKTLTVSSGTGGDCTTPGEGEFEYDDEQVVNIVATADAGYHFVNWTGTAVTAGKVADTNDPTTTVTVSDDYTLVANFEADEPPAQPADDLDAYKFCPGMAGGFDGL